MAPPRKLLGEARLRRRVAELGRELTRDYSGKELVVIGLLSGSFVFLSDLIRSIRLPLDLDFLKASSYGSGTSSAGRVRIEFRPSRPLQGRHVLLVEDIVDTGRTMRTVLGLLKRRRPASLRVAALLHKPARECVRVPIDYLGFTIPDVFVVGYGLDHDGRHRNLPYVGVLDA
jgi:hypoxanthine phosphoribosyltransferase